MERGDSLPSSPSLMPMSSVMPAEAALPMLARSRYAVRKIRVMTGAIQRSSLRTSLFSLCGSSTSRPSSWEASLGRMASSSICFSDLSIAFRLCRYFRMLGD